MSEFLDIEPTRLEVPPSSPPRYPANAAPIRPPSPRPSDPAFGALMAGIQQHRLCPCGQPRVIYTAYSPQGTSFIVAMPVDRQPTDLPAHAALSVSNLYGGRALHFLHRGPYPDLRLTYGKITQWMKQEGLLQSEADWARYMPMWEEYLNDPETTPAQELKTYIYVPLP